jgi:hypothetical protein
MAADHRTVVAPAAGLSQCRPNGTRSPGPGVMGCGMGGSLGVVVVCQPGLREGVLRVDGATGFFGRPHGNVVGVDVVVVAVVVVGPVSSCEPHATTGEPMATAAVRPSAADHRRAPFHVVRRGNGFSVGTSMFAMPRGRFRKSGIRSWIRTSAPLG